MATTREFLRRSAGVAMTLLLVARLGAAERGGGQEVSSARPAETLAKQPDEQEAIRRGLAYVEGKSLSWLRERKCASCHHVPMMVWAQRDARQRGLKIDEKGLREATDFLLAADNRAAVVPNPGEEDRPGIS